MTTHWTDAQRERLCALMTDPNAWIGYWCTDPHGQPARYGTPLPRAAAPGVIHEAPGPLLPKCGAGQLHATRQAHRWPGVRVWIVALLGARRGDDEKSWALRREVVGEVLPAEAILDAGVALRLSAWRLGANLEGAYLARANLEGAYLARANLEGADLRGANLARANLEGADLRGAYLAGADLRGANLARANLADADLRGAYLAGAKLAGANLEGAYLAGAYLAGANLEGADLGGWACGPDGYATRTP